MAAMSPLRCRTNRCIRGWAGRRPQLGADRGPARRGQLIRPNRASSANMMCKRRPRLAAVPRCWFWDETPGPAGSLPPICQRQRATDRARRRKRVPKVPSRPRKSPSRPSMHALWQLRWVCASCLPRGVVLIDAGYGVETDLSTNITNPYGRHPAQTTVWHPALGRNRPRTARSPATSKDVVARPQAPTDLVSGAGDWPVNLLV